jgi:hypothetical protein
LQVIPGQQGQFVPQQQPAFQGYGYPGMPQQAQQQPPPQYVQQPMQHQAMMPPQEQYMTPAQQRDAHRQQFAQSAMRHQAAVQQQAQPQSWYNQWQQVPQQYQQPQVPQGFVQQGQQQYVDPNMAPAMQQAYQQGYQHQLPGYAQPIQHFAGQQDELAFDPNGQFNPMAYGGEAWRDGVRQALYDPRQRVFDRQGHINAYNTKDALVQIKHMLQNSVREAKMARFHRQASQMMTEERRQILAAAVQDPEGFSIMGQELLLPIKDLVDYEGWVRKVYRVRPLAQGELFRIAKDVRSTAWVIGQDGQGIEARLFGRYVTPSEFKIGSFPTVDIEEIYQMNYDVLDRAQDTARQEIELEEDKRGRALIDVASQTVNAVTSYSTLGVAAFEDVRYQVERHRLVVEKFLINRAELSDIVKTMSAQVDPVTERELILAGYIGSFLNAVIITSAGTGVEEVVPSGTFYAVTGPEYMGEMGIRVELFSEPFNMFSQMRFVKGWAFGEIIGFVIANPRSCAKGTKS